MSTVVKLAMAVVAGAMLAGCNPEEAAKAVRTTRGDSGGVKAFEKMAKDLTSQTTGDHMWDEFRRSAPCSVPGAAVGLKTDAESGVLGFGACRGGAELVGGHPAQ